MDSLVDIFRKEKDGTLVWIAAVVQLHTAAALVAELFQESPGEYCVFATHAKNKRTANASQTKPRICPLEQTVSVVGNRCSRDD